MSDSKRQPPPIPLLEIALLSALVATWAGLGRMGWNLPWLTPELGQAHGPLMVAGFLGTVIGVERAIALQKRWTFIGPTLSGVGGLLLLTSLPTEARVSPG